MSKYCVHCGYQMDDTAGFCMRCGKPALVTRNRQPEPAKRKKGAFVWLIIAAVLLAAAFSILAFFRPGFGRNWFRKTAKLQNGIVEMDELSFDFSATGMRDGAVSLAKDRMPDGLKDEGLVSDLYEMTIEGECSDPVTVTMKVPKEYTGKDGQALMLAIGTDYDVSTEAEIGRHYYYVEAVVEGDTATAEFVPEEVLTPKLLYRKSGRTYLSSEESKKKYTGSRVIRFGETLRNWVSGENPRFLISYPYFYTVSESDTNAFIKDLEDMWDWYAAEGYSFEGLQPIYIYVITGSDGDVDAAFSRSKTGDPQIEFRKKFVFGTGKNSDYAGTRHLARPLMYHEFFHAIQDQYVGTNKHSLWFDEATATYYEHCAEKRFGISNVYKYAKTTELNYLFSLESMIPTNKKITQLEQNAEKVTVWDMIKEKDRNLKNKKFSLIGDEGYARGPFCDIVSEIKEGDDWIRNIYENWKTGGVTDFREIEKVAESIPNLALKYYRRFIDGTYTDTGFMSDEGKANYYYSRDILDLSDSDIEALKNGTKEYVRISGTTRNIHGQGAVVVGLAFRNIHKLAGDTRFHVLITIEGKDLESEIYELWEHDAFSTGGSLISDIYKAMKKDNKRFSTLVVSKKPFNTDDTVTITYEITADVKEEETKAQETEDSSSDGVPAMPEDKGHWELTNADIQWNGINTSWRWPSRTMTHAEFTSVIGSKEKGTEREFRASFDWQEPPRVLVPGEEYFLAWSVNASEKLEYWYDEVPNCSYDWWYSPTWSNVAEITGKDGTILTPFQKDDEAKSSDSGVAVLTVNEGRSSRGVLTIKFRAQFSEAYWHYEWIAPPEPTEATEAPPIEPLGTYKDSYGKTFTIYSFDQLGTLLEDEYSEKRKYEELAKSIDMYEWFGKLWWEANGRRFDSFPLKDLEGTVGSDAIEMDDWVTPGESAAFYALYKIEGTKYGNVAGLVKARVVNDTDEQAHAYDCRISYISYGP